MKSVASFVSIIGLTIAPIVFAADTPCPEDDLAFTPIIKAVVRQRTSPSLVSPPIRVLPASIPLRKTIEVTVGGTTRRYDGCTFTGDANMVRYDCETMSVLGVPAHPKKK